MPELLSTVVALKIAQKTLNDVYDFLLRKGGEKIDELKNEKTIASLESKLQQLTIVKTIKNIDKPVDLNTFFYPPKMVCDTDKTQKNINVISDLSATRKILIQGTVGQGKSILMRFLASKELESSGRIPLFFELRKLEGSQTIVSVIKSLLSDWLFITKDQAIDSLLSSGKIVLFLDGYDELTSTQASIVVRDIEQLHTKYGANLQIIISSRFNSGIENLSIFHNYRIKPLGLIEQKGVISRLTNDIDLREKLIGAIKLAKTDVKELLITPLLLTMFVMTYSSQQIIPESISEFYEQIFQLLLVRHDNTKITLFRPRDSKLTNDQLKIVFETIACMSVLENKFVMKETEFLAVIKESARYNRVEEDSNKILNDITKCLCLILQDGTDYTYIHKSIAEFFCASFIKNHNDPYFFYKKIEKNYFKFKIISLFLEQIDKYRFFTGFLRASLERAHQFYVDQNSENYILRKIFITEIGGKSFSTTIVVPDDFTYFLDFIDESDVIGDAHYTFVKKNLYSHFMTRYLTESQWKSLNDYEIAAYVPLFQRQKEFPEFVDKILESEELIKNKLSEIDVFISLKNDISIFSEN